MLILVDWERKRASHCSTVPFVAALVVWPFASELAISPPLLLLGILLNKNLINFKVQIKHFYSFLFDLYTVTASL